MAFTYYFSEDYFYLWEVNWKPFFSTSSWVNRGNTSSGAKLEKEEQEMRPGEPCEVTSKIFFYCHHYVNISLESYAGWIILDPNRKIQFEINPQTDKKKILLTRTRTKRSSGWGDTQPYPKATYFNPRPNLTRNTSIRNPTRTWNERK